MVASEALANVAKHSAATHAEVTLSRAGNLLVMEVRDDGHGGADPTAGSGLTGLADRVGAVNRPTTPCKPHRRADRGPRGVAVRPVVRVVLAEDGVLLREGLTGVLARFGLEVVAAVGDAAALLDAVAAHRPDLVVTDIRMPWPLRRGPAGRGRAARGPSRAGRCGA